MQPATDWFGRFDDRTAWLLAGCARWRGPVITTDSPQSTTQELRRVLWPRIADSTEAWVAELAVALEELPAGDGATTRIEDGARLAHAIAGRAGLYGFRAEARAAAHIEELLRTGVAVTPVDMAAALVALGQLQAGFRVDA